MDNLRVVETADDMDQRIDLPDVPQKLIAEPFSLGLGDHSQPFVSPLFADLVSSKCDTGDFTLAVESYR